MKRLHQVGCECGCRCLKCGAAMELDPIFGLLWSRCGDCAGGREPDGEAFRGGEAAAYERQQMAEWQGLK